jgi:hypothetical protein
MDYGPAVEACCSLLKQKALSSYKIIYSIAFAGSRARSASRGNQAGLKPDPLPIGQRSAYALVLGWLPSVC